MNENQEARLQDAYDDLVAEAQGVLQFRDDPIGSREALRMAKVRLREMESVLDEAHG